MSFAALMYSANIAEVIVGAFREVPVCGGKLAPKEVEKVILGGVNR